MFKRLVQYRQHILIAAEEDYSTVGAGLLLEIAEVINSVGSKGGISLFLTVIPGRAFKVVDLDVFVADSLPHSIQGRRLGAIELGAEGLASVTSEVHNLAQIDATSRIVRDTKLKKPRSVLTGVDKYIGIVK